jgi:hypothetical protein
VSAGRAKPDVEPIGDVGVGTGTMQNVVRQHDLDIVDAARLFAMGDLVMSDAGMACLDSKYF